MCVGFDTNHAKVYPIMEDQQKEMDLEDTDGTSSASKPKKRPLRKFDDHLG